MLRTVAVDGEPIIMRPNIEKKGLLVASDRSGQKKMLSLSVTRLNLIIRYNPKAVFLYLIQPINIFAFYIHINNC